MSFKQFWNKYKDVIPYIFFGACTTVVNVIGYLFFAHVLGQSVMFSAIVAWVLAVYFAYLTNRKWVFHSETKTVRDIVKEILSFFGCRLATGVLDWVSMFFCVTKFGWNDVYVKVIANIIVIILNYVASKFYIFRSEDR